MGRHRAAGRADQRAEQQAAEAAELQREGRRWFVRALLAAVAAGAVSLLSWVVAVLLGVVATVCVAKGVGRAVDGFRLLQG